MGSKVLTLDEIHDLETAIYNDRNDILFKALDTCLPEDVMEDKYQETIKELAKGQEYYIIPDTDIMVRKDGRLFNAKFIRAIKPMWTPHDIIVIVNRKGIRYSEIYKSQNWKFEQKEIAKRFVKENWPISISSGYQETFKELYF